MREIKFRAWDNELKEFVTDYDDGMYSEVVISGDGVRAVSKELTCYCGPPGCGGCADTFEEHGDITLEQYTGLKDRKGVEIYEGDIVEGSVGFGLAHLQVKWFGEGHGNCWYPFNHIHKGEHCEVIGNIHDGSTGD